MRELGIPISDTMTSEGNQPDEKEKQGSELENLDGSEPKE